MKTLIKTISLIYFSWIVGWLTYMLGLSVFYHENPFQGDVFLLGFWSLFIGSAYCAVVVAPILLTLRYFLKENVTKLIFVIAAAALGLLFMAFFTGWRTNPESIFMHIHAGVMSAIFGGGLFAI